MFVSRGCPVCDGFGSVRDPQEDYALIECPLCYSKKRREMNKDKIIAVDFDGVLHAYSKGWHDGSIYGDPIPGSARAMHRLKIEGYRLVIFSTRAYPQNPFTGEHQGDQVKEMEKWLSRHRIVYDEIWTKPWKPAAIIFIDDRAYRFPHVNRPSVFSLLREVIFPSDPWQKMEWVLEKEGVLESSSEYSHEL